MGWKFTRSNGTDWRTGRVDYRSFIGKELVYPGGCEKGDACGDTGYHLGKTLRGAGKYAKPEAVFRCSYSRRDLLGEDEHKVRVSRLTVLGEVPAWKGYGPRGRQVQAFIDSLKDIPWFAHVGEPINGPTWAGEISQVDGWDAAVDAARAAAGGSAWAAARDAAADAAVGAAGAAAWSAAWAIARDVARDTAGAAAWSACAAAWSAWAAWAAAMDAAWDVARAAAGDATWAAVEIMGGIMGYFSQLMEVYRMGHYPIAWDGRILVVF